MSLGNQSVEAESGAWRIVRTDSPGLWGRASHPGWVPAQPLNPFPANHPWESEFKSCCTGVLALNTGLWDDEEKVSFAGSPV